MLMERIVAQEYCDTETRKEQIASAVLKISAGEGFSAVTLERVAREIGVVPSAVYRHYPNKSVMIDGALDLVKERILQNIEEVRAEVDDPLEFLRALLYRHVGFVVNDLGAGGTFFSIEVGSHYPEKKKKIFENMLILRKEVLRCVNAARKQKRIRDDMNADQVVNLYFGMFVPAVMQFQLHGNMKTLQKTIDDNWSMFCTLTAA